MPNASSIKSTPSLDITLPFLLKVNTSTSLIPAIATKFELALLNLMLSGLKLSLCESTRARSYPSFNSP